MSYKEWNAVVQVLGVVLVGAWLVNELLAANPSNASINAVAVRLLWAAGALVALNIVGMIVVTILSGIFRAEALRDARADERDDAIDARSSRIGYAAGSIAATLALVALAFGAEPLLAVYALLGAPMVGGAAAAASLLVFYRVG